MYCLQRERITGTRELNRQVDREFCKESTFKLTNEYVSLRGMLVGAMHS